MHSFSFFLATSYYHAIYIVFTYFAPFTCYEDDIFEVIPNLHVQGSNLAENLTNLAENLLKIERCRVYGVSYFQVCTEHPDHFQKTSTTHFGLRSAILSADWF